MRLDSGATVLVNSNNLLPEFLEAPVTCKKIQNFFDFLTRSKASGNEYDIPNRNALIKKEAKLEIFYQMIIHHFPQSVEQAFKVKYERIEWEHNEIHFNAWCEGKTGYPLVDAGMRELNTTGFMHNRVRMVVASFLCKHLLLDWKWGAAYFAEKLLDYEEASNIGGWQWAAGCGCDAAPYFRVFNPTLQQQKFDPKMEYIKKWIPEFDTKEYPEPIIEHTFARDRVINRYKTALNEIS
jgi:deoxyribodipyrimidine photo-lyase